MPTDLESRPQLARLADSLGVVREYWDIGGGRHATSAETAEALCAALGYDASGEAAAEASRARLASAAREPLVEPSQVWRDAPGERPALGLLRAATPGVAARVEVEIEHEAGPGWSAELPVPMAPPGEAARIPIPGDLRPGVYSVRLELDQGAPPNRGVQRLVVAPATALTVEERLGSERAVGLWTNLYTVRSRRNWGFGDLGDAGQLLQASADAGGDFVGVNPLHAIRNRGSGVSPYSPVSRLFRNLLYLDVEAVPELAECPEARMRIASDAVRTRLARLREAPRIEHGEVLALKLEVLRDLFSHFERREARAPSERGRRYGAFAAREGDALVDFATFEVLSAFLEAGDWPRWSDELRDPRSAAVGRFRQAHAEEVRLHGWLQFELDEQIAAAAAQGRGAGMRVGLYHDLAVGSARDSADTWMFPEAFVADVGIGAPPDDFAPEGQDWGLAPLDPHRLRADGYRLFERLLDAAMRHTGALRIDHVMGLQRQFFIPAGSDASQGAYVRFPLDDLLGVVALASRRHHSLVIGEDLGTVPAELPGVLASWGILSSSVLLFEREHDGFRAPGQISPRALATFGTHDLAPLAGYVAGRDLELRRAAGAIASDAALSEALGRRRAEIEALIARLRAEGILDAGETPDPPRLCQAVGEFLARSPAPLVGISLDDLAGEEEPINLPGIPTDVHPSWTRRMRLPLDDLLGSPGFRLALGRGAPPRRSDRLGTPVRTRGQQGWDPE